MECGILEERNYSMQILLHNKLIWQVIKYAVILVYFDQAVRADDISDDMRV